MKHILIIAAKELNDRLRSGWVIACVAVWLGAIVLTSLFGLVQIGQIGLQGYQRTVVSLLNLAQYLIPLLALLLGHDLIVSEREERTLALILASGVSRRRALLGKFIGGCLTLVVPLVVGFGIAGVTIGLGAGDRDYRPFVTLAASGLVLGVIFIGIGVALSTLARTRVQALVAALLTWCVAIFVFDLVALGVLVNMKSVQANQDIEINCEATHVNAGGDIHAAYEQPVGGAARQPILTGNALAAWLAVNPVDLFRSVNLPSAHVSPVATALSIGGWLAGAVGLAIWKLRRVDV